MKPIAFQEYNGIPVSIDCYGNFTAEIGGYWLREVTYERLKTRIEEHMRSEVKGLKLSLPCFALFRDEATGLSCEPVVLTGLNRNDASLKFKGNDGRGCLFAVPDTPENRLLVSDYVTSGNEYTRLGELLKNRKIEGAKFSGRIEASDYDRRIGVLNEKYLEALAESKSQQ